MPDDKKSLSTSQRTSRSEFSRENTNPALFHIRVVGEDFEVSFFDPLSGEWSSELGDETSEAAVGAQILKGKGSFAPKRKDAEEEPDTLDVSLPGFDDFLDECYQTLSEAISEALDASEAENGYENASDSETTASLPSDGVPQEDVIEIRRDVLYAFADKMIPTPSAMEELTSTTFKAYLDHQDRWEAIITEDDLVVYAYAGASRRETVVIRGGLVESKSESLHRIASAEGRSLGTVFIDMLLQRK
jgi:hypothetical protein